MADGDAMVPLTENHPETRQNEPEKEHRGIVCFTLQSPDWTTTMKQDETDIMPNGIGLGRQIFKINNASKP
jgi:hypothetical protein